MCSVESVRRVIRVKRKANEEKNVSHKRCKYIGSCHTNDDKDVHQLLVSSQTLSQQQIQQEVDTLMITDCEEFLPFDCNQDLDHKINSLKHNQIITCNGEPLESVENDLSESLDYIYDIYVYENDQNLHSDQNDYRECDHEDVSSNDENYMYNDYPDEHEVSDEVFDYYTYRDLEETDSHTDLRLAFGRSRISSDYDLSDESLDRYYRKDSSDDSSYDEREDGEEEKDE